MFKIAAPILLSFVVGIWLLFALVNFRTAVFSGQAKNTGHFRSQLDAAEIQLFALPKAQSISYFLQPNMGRFFIDGAISESEFKRWIQESGAEVSELIAQRDVSWMDDSDQPTLSFSTGLESKDWEYGDAVYCRTSGRFYIWNGGVSH